MFLKHRDVFIHAFKNFERYWSLLVFFFPCDFLEFQYLHSHAFYSFISCSHVYFSSHGKGSVLPIFLMIDYPFLAKCPE